MIHFLSLVLMSVLLAFGAAAEETQILPEGSVLAANVAKAFQALDPDMIGFGPAGTVPVSGTYKLCAVVCKRSLPSLEAAGKYPMDTAVLALAIVQDDTPLLLLGTLLLERIPKPDWEDGRTYELDSISENQITFAAHSTHYGSWRPKVKVFFNIEEKRSLGQRELDHLKVSAIAVSNNVVWCAGQTWSGRGLPEPPSKNYILKVPLDPQAGAPELLAEINGQPVPVLKRDAFAEGKIAFQGPEYRCILGDEGWTLEKSAEVLKPRMVEFPASEGKKAEKVQLDEWRTVEGLDQGSEVAVAPAGVAIKDSFATPVVYPIENFDYEFFKEKRKDALAGASSGFVFTPENTIGGWQIAGTKIVFGTNFYDGEGTSGVGAIGYFDLTKRTYRFEFPNELTTWSTSAILVEDDCIWVGAKRQPEEQDYSRGLLRYDKKDGASQWYRVPPIILSIKRAGKNLLLGTEDGLYVLTDSGMIRANYTVTVDGKPDIQVESLSEREPILDMASYRFRVTDPF
jgi:hypothetical protein